MGTSSLAAVARTSIHLLSLHYANDLLTNLHINPAGPDLTHGFGNSFRGRDLYLHYLIRQGHVRDPRTDNLVVRISVHVWHVAALRVGGCYGLPKLATPPQQLPTQG